MAKDNLCQIFSHLIYWIKVSRVFCDEIQVNIIYFKESKSQFSLYNSCALHQCILDLFDGAEAVGGGGGPVLNSSSM